MCNSHLLFLFVYLFICLFVYLFIYSFIYYNLMAQVTYLLKVL